MASSAAAVAVAVAALNKKRKYWTEEEDRILAEYIELNGRGEWNQVSKNTRLCEAGKTGNSCQLRWMNHLNPEINTGPFTTVEEDTIIFFRNVVYGGENKWARIAEVLRGRTGNQVKNCWNTKKLCERPTLTEERIRNLCEKVFLRVDHEPMDSTLEIDQDLLEDELDVQQQLFEESINTGGLSRVNSSEQILFEYTQAPDFNQFSMNYLN